MQTIRDHQFDAIPLGGQDHLPAIGGRHGKGLFTQDMYAGTSCPHGVFAMETVRQGNVHGINLAASQTLFVVFVGIGVGDPVLSAEEATLQGVVRYQRGQPCRGFCMREGGKHGNLGNMSKTDDRKTQW